MTKIHIRLGQLEFIARLEEDSAPNTCALFKSLLPYNAMMTHAGWSGEAGIVVLDHHYEDLAKENNTSHPAPGQILFYAGRDSEPKLLFPYGPSCFNSKVGQLAGNYFLTIDEGLDDLAKIDHLLLWQGAQKVSFHLAD